jgi:hypothetical protein
MFEKGVKLHPIIQGGNINDQLQLARKYHKSQNLERMKIINYQSTNFFLNRAG